MLRVHGQARPYFLQFNGIRCQSRYYHYGEWNHFEFVSGWLSDFLLFKIFSIEFEFEFNFLKGGTTPQIQDAIGTTMSFQELKRLLFKSGINLFPDKDVFCYCESTSRNCNHFIFL